MREHRLQFHGGQPAAWANEGAISLPFNPTHK